MSFKSLVWLAARGWSVLKPLTIIKRKGRLREFRAGARGSLATAAIDLRSGCGCPRCLGIGYVSEREARPYAKAKRTPTLNYLRPTAAIIDLEALASHDAFVKAVSYSSGGNDTRMVKKARRLGYAARRIAPNSYARSIALVKESMPVRSQGVVVHSVVKASRGLVDTRRPFVPPTCSGSWLIDWGIFGPAEGGERMMAFAQTRRSGNYVEIAHLMGHGDALKHGVVKLLLFEMLAWFFADADPLVHGVRFVHYGAIESGSPVTTQWRRYMQFRPHLLDIVDHDPSPIPAGFSGWRYLSLNTDVADIGMDPYVHYALYGIHRGRPYRAGDRRFQPPHARPAAPRDPR